MRQKFGKLKFVRVCRDLPPSMSHFHSDFDAIVKGSYSQIYGGDNIKEYSLYMIKDGRVVDNISWYSEEHLTLDACQDRDKAEDMIEEYNLR